MEEIKFTKVAHKNEIYPVEYLYGAPGFTYRQAICVKAQQERYMSNDTNVIEICVEVLPIPERKEEYYVKNTSTYVKELTLKNSTEFTLPPWIKQTEDGRLEFLTSYPF